MTLDYEERCWNAASTPVGVDEAGRGALAGPVVAAAVVLDRSSIPSGVNDSKQLSPRKRIQLRDEITASAVAWSVGIVDAATIDQINILQATFMAMHVAIDRCVQHLDAETCKPHLLIDGNRFTQHKLPYTTVVHGDAISPSIAAASILAKTTRDLLMINELHKMYPQYGFDVHKGYGTAIHRNAIITFGTCPEHRISFLKNIVGKGATDALNS